MRVNHVQRAVHILGAVAIVATLLAMALAYLYPRALFTIVFLGYYAVWRSYYAFVPAYAAELQIEKLDTKIRLELFYTDYPDGALTDGIDYGRHLIINGSSGRITREICGFDWANRARTGIYLAADRKIAVVGPDRCDYLVSLEQLTISRASGLPSESWTYLGAFDFVGSPGGPGPTAFRFISAAEQDECVEDDHFPAWAVRKNARKGRCPAFQASGSQQHQR